MLMIKISFSYSNRANSNIGIGGDVGADNNVDNAVGDLGVDNNVENDAGDVEAYSNGDTPGHYKKK